MRITDILFQRKDVVFYQDSVVSSIINEKKDWLKDVILYDIPWIYNITIINFPDFVHVIDGHHTLMAFDEVECSADVISQLIKIHTVPLQSIYQKYGWDKLLKQKGFRALKIVDSTDEIQNFKKFIPEQDISINVIFYCARFSDDLGKSYSEAQKVFNFEKALKITPKRVITSGFKYCKYGKSTIKAGEIYRVLADGLKYIAEFYSDRLSLLKTGNYTVCDSRHFFDQEDNVWGVYPQ